MMSFRQFLKQNNNPKAELAEETKIEIERKDKDRKSRYDEYQKQRIRDKNLARSIKENSRKNRG